MKNRLGMMEQVVPLLAPIDAGVTEQKVFVNASISHRVTFLCYFGVLSALSNEAVNVSVLACTSAATTGGTAIAFNYRVSAATGTDTLGAVVAATTAGITVSTTAADGMLYIIDIDPKALPAVAEDAKYVCLNVTPDAGTSVTLMSVIALLEPRYAATTMLASC